MGAVYDKTGRKIEIGDILKVFHFVGARRKRHFMYKQVVYECVLGRDKPAPFFYLSHLNFLANDGYHIPLNGAHLRDYEIVQSIDARFEDRPRVAPAPPKGSENG